MENTISKARIYLTLFALGCAGGSIYIIPYIRSVFYDLQLQVTGMTNTQSAFLMSVYAAFGMIIGVPVGMIVDRLNLKDGIRWALIGTTIVTIVYSFTYTSYVGSMLIWCAICVFTSIYWPAFSKILSIVGQKTDKTGEGKSGLAFGIYYAFNGISAAVINSISLWASTQFDNPYAAFRAPIFVAAAGTLIAAILVHFLMDDELVNLAEQARAAEKNNAPKEKTKISLAEYVSILKIPMTWMMLIVCLVGYMLYSLQSYFTPYLTNVVGISAAESGIFGIIRTYVFLVLAMVGGFMADKVFKSPSKWMAVAFAIMAVVVAGIFIIPSGANPMLIGFYTLLPSAFVQMTYTIKYSTINETGIPAHLIGTTTSLASTIAGLVDLVLAPFIGWCLDTKGNAGYDILFIILIISLLLGSVCAMAIVKSNKKRLAGQKIAS